MSSFDKPEIQVPNPKKSKDRDRDLKLHMVVLEPNSIPVSLTLKGGKERTELENYFKFCLFHPFRKVQLKVIGVNKSVFIVNKMQFQQIIDKHTPQ